MNAAHKISSSGALNLQHSRKGGKPEQGQRRWRVPHWIPAFAGMTGLAGFLSYAKTLSPVVLGQFGGVDR